MRGCVRRAGNPPGGRTACRQDQRTAWGAPIDRRRARRCCSGTREDHIRAERGHDLPLGGVANPTPEGKRHPPGPTGGSGGDLIRDPGQGLERRAHRRSTTGRHSARSPQRPPAPRRPPDHEGEGEGARTAGLGDRGPVVDKRRLQAAALGEGAHLLHVLVGGDGHQRQPPRAVVPVQALELRQLLEIQLAPGPPEVDEHHPSGEQLRTHGVPTDGLDSNGRSRPPRPAPSAHSEAEPSTHRRAAQGADFWTRPWPARRGGRVARRRVLCRRRVGVRRGVVPGALRLGGPGPRPPSFGWRVLIEGREIVFHGRHRLRPLGRRLSVRAGHEQGERKDRQTSAFPVHRKLTFASSSARCRVDQNTPAPPRPRRTAAKTAPCGLRTP